MFWNVASKFYNLKYSAHHKQHTAAAAAAAHFDDPSRLNSLDFKNLKRRRRRINNCSSNKCWNLEGKEEEEEEPGDMVMDRHELSIVDRLMIKLCGCHHFIFKLKERNKKKHAHGLSVGKRSHDE